VLKVGRGIYFHKWRLDIATKEFSKEYYMTIVLIVKKYSEASS
jgi:hypothetical protein